MRTADVIAQAVRPLWIYKLRSILSVLGIAIGVGSVVALVIVLQSASQNVVKRVQSLGSNLVVATVNPPVRSGDARNLPLSRARTIGLVRGVSQEAPVNYMTGVVGYKGRRLGLSIYGSNAMLPHILRYKLAYGRYLSPADVHARLNVVDLGAQTSRQLFGSANPTGRTVMLDGEPYTVVGVLAAKGAMLGINQDTVAIVPITAYQAQMHLNTVNFVYISAKSANGLAGVMHRIALNFTHWFHDSNRFTLLTQAEVLNMADQVSRMLAAIMLAVATISIVVGGIGMLNVLLISVSERVREIGVRKSLGARRRDILRQFLAEAMVLSLVGGGLGVAIGVSTAMILTRSMKIGFHINLLVPTGALAGSVFLGIIFGLYPAARASLLPPAEAIRVK